MHFFGKFVRSKCFSFLFLIVAVLSVFYVSNRLDRFFACVCHLNVYGIVLALLMALMIYMFIYIKSKNPKVKNTRKFYEGCGIVLCFLLYVVIFFALYDLTDMVFHIHNNLYYMIPILGALLLAFYGFIHAKKICIKEYDVPLAQIRKNKKVVLISDIHTGTFVNTIQLKKIVDKINSLNADMVLIAGDMFDVGAYPYCNIEEIVSILQKLSPKGEIYAILGNHDPASDTDTMKQFYQKAGIQLLVDDVITTHDFTLIGRDDITSNPQRKSLQDLLNTTFSSKPAIVMDHNPLGIDEAVKHHIDLIVCGHTHKGQFFPANIFTHLAYGSKGYYGHYYTDTTQSIVSSGAGYFEMPMRVGSNSEIVVMNIHPHN